MSQGRKSRFKWINAGESHLTGPEQPEFLDGSPSERSRLPEKHGFQDDHVCLHADPAAAKEPELRVEPTQPGQMPYNRIPVQLGLGSGQPVSKRANEEMSRDNCWICRLDLRQSIKNPRGTFHSGESTRNPEDCRLTVFHFLGPPWVPATGSFARTVCPSARSASPKA